MADDVKFPRARREKASRKPRVRHPGLSRRIAQQQWEDRWHTPEEVAFKAGTVDSTDRLPRNLQVLVGLALKACGWVKGRRVLDDGSRRYVYKPGSGA